MAIETTGEHPRVDVLVEQVSRKLKAQRAIIDRSIEHGTITWRLKGNGFDIKVKVEI